MGRGATGTIAPEWWNPDTSDSAVDGWGLPLWNGEQASAATGRPSRLRLPPKLAIWRAPEDQPRWARPILLSIAALAGLAYAWAFTSQPLESFYGYATRSMALNWRNFFFGSVDPWGTVTIDKLPGSLWVDAMSVRIFGFHLWSVVLPQVVAGVFTILVLYRAVRRLAGPVAGITAAAVLAASPVTVLLNRGNIPDSLMILLVVLAADATSAAITSGNRRHLWWAAVWVGLAFQAKMLDAWLIVPALFLAYLVSGVESPARRRLDNCLIAGFLTVVVSLSWMVVVTLVPSAHRPYFDGSGDNSVFTQVFVYNGLDRFRALAHFDHALGPPAPFLHAFIVGQPHEASYIMAAVPAGIGRLFTGWFGRDGGWLLPIAAVALVVLLVMYRRDRKNPIFAAAVLWGGWLVLEFVSLSTGASLRSYYLAAITPAVAALTGIGFSVAFEKTRDSKTARALITACVLGTVLYAGFLLPRSEGAWDWVVPVLIVMSALSAVLLLVPRFSARLRSTGLLIGLAAVLLTPTVAVVSETVAGLGPFDGPFEPAAVAQYSAKDRLQWVEINQLLDHGDPFPYPINRAALVVDTSDEAGGFGMVTGAEVLPVGGFSGSAPSPTLSQLKADIRAGRVGEVLVPVRPSSPDPRFEWVVHHCQREFPEGTDPVLFYNYLCTPSLTPPRATTLFPGQTPGPSIDQALDEIKQVPTHDTGYSARATP